MDPIKSFRDYFAVVVENTKKESDGLKPDIRTERNRLSKVMVHLLGRKPTEKEMEQFLK